MLLSIFDAWHHSHGHSDFQIAKALAARFPVLFVNSIGMRAPLPGRATSPLRRARRKLASMMRPQQQLWSNLAVSVMTPLSVPAYQGPAAAFNEALVAVQIRRSLAKIGIDRFSVLVTAPTFSKIAGSLAATSILYNRSDRHSAFPGIDQEVVAEHEARLLRSADAVLYASASLYREEAGDLDERGVLIGHGIDLAAFSPAGPVDPVVAAIPHPRVGFFGELRERFLDFELVAGIAAACPNIHFVLGGGQLEALAPLRPAGNIHLLGPCNHELMPARWRAVDVAFLPYKMNRWVEAIQPIKLNEILATGLRAVGTPVPAFLGHADAVVTASEPSQIVEAIVRLVSQGEIATGEQVAQRRAQLRSWDNVAESVVQLSHI